MIKKSFKALGYLLPIILITIDYLVLSLAFEIALYVRSEFFTSLSHFDSLNSANYRWVIVIVLFLFLYENIYTKRYDYWSDFYKIIKAFFYSFLLILSFMTLSKSSYDYSRLFIVIFFAVALFLIPVAKRITKRVLFRFDIFKAGIKILADEEEYKTLAKEMEKNWYLGYKIADKAFDMVLISSQKYGTQKLQSVIAQYSCFTKDIYIIPYLQNIDFTHSEMISYSNLRVSAFHIENRLLNPKNRILKSLFEKMLIIALLPFAFFLHIVLFFIIKLDSKGSIFFKQNRLGKDEKLFSCYKYRSMYENSDGVLQEYLQNNPKERENYEIYHKYENDPRITKAGRFLRATSLDELPQFINILRGEMSLIGPRPYMYEEREKMGEQNRALILKVSPGITGLWQVSGRNELTFQERIELDTWYIQNWSLWMDFVIFLKTVKVVLSKVGAR